VIDSELEERLRRICSSHKKPIREITHESFERNLERYLQAEEKRTPYGSCLVRHDYYPNGYRHGASDIHSFLSASPHTVSRLMNNISESEKKISDDKQNSAFLSIPLEKYLFLDIETTGLSGGVGVCPFLIGTGYFKEGDFHVFQLFMRDYHEEQAVLYLLAEIIEDEGLKGLITYNGKSYDTNILTTRSITSGIDLPISGMPNFDLLFPVRRIFKRRIGDCSLSSIEREVLGFYRVDDIPGYQVPEIYFDFIRRGFSELMRKVFIHNLYDILSMCAIAERLCALYSDPIEYHAEPEDLYQIANLYKKNGDIDDAMRVYRHLSSFDDILLSYQANLALSFMLKRRGEYKRACEIWEKCIEEHPKYSVVPYIELAKYHEHCRKDYKKALLYTKSGMEIASPYRNRRFDFTEFEKRIKRLNSKISKKR